ncbi:MAG: hydrogenase maturation protease [Actinomycetota bacterium]|nr:hydrogenase maturation protease [Actinomycetota bacterium]
MSYRIALIGVGNRYRGDDGVGPAVVAQIAKQQLPGVTCTVASGEPTELIEAWQGTQFAVLVDAAVCDPSAPGRIHRTVGESWHESRATSSHGLGVAEAVRLAEALHRLPPRLVVFAVEAADTGFRLGLSAEVEAAVPALTAAVLAELGERS